jgi:hypothetical protein
MAVRRARSVEALSASTWKGMREDGLRHDVLRKEKAMRQPLPVLRWRNCAVARVMPAGGCCGMTTRDARELAC